MPVTFSEEDFAAPAAPATESPHEFSEDDFKAPSEDALRSDLGVGGVPIARSPMELAAQNFAMRQQASGKAVPPQEGTGPQEPFEIGGTQFDFPNKGQLSLPHAQPPADAGTLEKVAAGLYNTGAGAANFIASPAGIATAMVPAALPLRIAKPLLGTIFAPTLAAQTYQAGKKAFSTGDAQDITEAVGTAAFGALAAHQAVSGYRGLLPKAGLAASLERAKSAPGAPEGAQTPAEAQTPAQPATAAQPAPPASLPPEHQSLLDAEREAIDHPIEVVDLPTSSNEPFARTRRAGQFMGINRQKGTIEVYPQEFSAWLEKDVPPERRALAVRSALAEEQNHLQVTPEQAGAYQQTLSAPERAIERRLYTGDWKGRGDISDTDLGFEAIRRRMQQAARMPSTEFAAAVLKDRLKIGTLEALNSTVRGIREGLGTKASKEGLAILDKIEGNIAAAAALATAPAQGPAAIRQTVPTAEELASMSPEDFTAWVKSAPGGYGPAFSKGVAGTLKESDVPKLEAQRDALRQQVKARNEQMRTEGYTPQFFSETGRLQLKAQTLNEIVQDFQDQQSGPAAIRQKIQIEKPDGSRVDGEFTGYWELPGKTIASVGRVMPDGKMSHGMLAPNEKIVGEVPTFQQWKAQQEPAPAAIRRKPKSGQEAFYLPPSERGQSTERNMPPAESAPLKVWPVQLDWEQAGKQGAYRPISDAEANNPQELSKLLKADARISGSNLPVSNTRRMLVMIDRNNGRVHMVSTYPSGRYGTMVVDPLKAGTERPNVPLGNLLGRFKPLVSLLRSEPVKNFHQSFDGIADYENRFGEEARNRSHESLGKLAASGVSKAYEAAVPRELAEPGTPIEPSDLVRLAAEPEPGAIPEASPEGEGEGAEGADAESVIAGEESGLRSQSDIPTDADLKAFHDFFEGETPGTKADFDFKIGKAAASASRQMANAVYLAAKHEAALNPLMEPEAAVESALSKLYEELANSGTRTEFIETATRRYRQGVAQTLQERRLGAAPGEAKPSSTGRELTLPRFSRRGAPAPRGEGPLPKLPPATAPEMLSPEDAARVRAEAAKKYPPLFPETLYRQIAQAEVPTEPYTMGKSEAAKFGEAAPEPKPGEFELESDLARGQFDPAKRGVPPEQGPGALRNLKRNLEDQAKEAGAAFTTMVQRHDVGNEVARGIESVENTVNNLANQADFDVRLRSIEKPKGKLAQNVTAWARGNRDILSAANVLIEARFDKSQLPKFQALLNQARSIGEADAQSPSWITRGNGKARLREVEKLQASLDFAAHNWQDPNLQRTAKVAAKNYQDIFDHEKASGYDVTKDPNYLPHRYVGGTRIGQRTFVKGKRFREPKAFDSLFEAIANPDDVYISATHDAASLVGHRTRQSLNMINKDQWLESLKAMNLPTGDKLALAPKMGAHGLVSPDSNYRLVTVAPGKILAIHNDFADGIQNLTSPDWVVNWGPTRGLLKATQMLKHSLLVGDFFHLARMGYYGASILGRKAGWKGGWTVLDIASHNIPEAVRRGVISAKDADWGREQIPFGNSTISRRQLVEKFYKQYGSNLGKIQDALYKDLLTEGSSASSLPRRALQRVADPTVGRYNRFLFDKLTRGLMAESVAREFERQSKAKPGANPDALMKDIARDVNNFYGNIGRQGWFKSAGMRSFMRLFALAPQWVEGLVKKEAVAYSRLSGVSSLAGKREGLTALGTTGSAVGKGMLAMAAITQAINIISRGHPTWMNDEKEHKFDAWIPSLGSNKDGFWLSPLAIYNELTHDFYRLTMSKPTFAEAAAQIAGNKESPLLRAAIILGTGRTPMGEQTTSTGERLKSAAGALAPVPITFGRYAQAAGHAIAPESVRAVPAGAMQRQAFGTAGIKIEPALSQTQQMSRMAKDFMQKEGLQKDTGWVEIQTTSPSYSKLRQAIRNNDEPQAARILKSLRKDHTNNQILKAMKDNARQGFTGSQKNERRFLGSLDDKQLESYTSALDAKLSGYNQFVDWYLSLPTPEN